MCNSGPQVGQGSLYAGITTFIPQFQKLIFLFLQSAFHQRSSDSMCRVYRSRCSLPNCFFQIWRIKCSISKKYLFCRFIEQVWHCRGSNFKSGDKIRNVIDDPIKRANPHQETPIHNRCRDGKVIKGRANAFLDG